MGIIERVQALPFGQEVIDSGFMKTNVFGVYFKKVPKIASSTLSQIMLELLYPNITQVDYKLFNPHKKTSKHYWLHISTGPLLNVRLGEELLSQANLFTFCRNPYRRLLSYYLNKFNSNSFLDDGEMEYIKRLRRDIVYCAVKDSMALETVLDKKHGISFEAFVYFVTRPDALSDFHWRPQVWVTGATEIPYRKIIRAENLEQELAVVLKQYCYIDLPVEEKLNVSKPTLLTDFYTEPLADMVYSFYKQDFGFFGYAKESWHTNDV